MASRFWVGGTGNWDASTTTNWSATSGGAGGASVPTSSDSVTFDSASNGTDYTVTITATANCLSLTVGAPATGKITLAGTSTLNVFGSVNMSGGTAGITLTWSGILTMKPTGTNTATIASNGIAWQGTMSIDSSNGATTTHADAFDNSAGNQIIIFNGIWTTNNQTITCKLVNINTGTKTINLGSSTVVLTGGGWSVAADTGFTLNAGTSTLKWTDSTNGGLTATLGNSKTYYNMWFDRGASTGTITFQNNTWSMNELKDTGTGAHTLTFNSFRTYSFNSFVVSGNAGNLITLDSSGGGPGVIFTSPSGTINCDYLSVSNVWVGGGATWNGGTHTTFGTNCFGWNDNNRYWVAGGDGNWNNSNNWSSSSGGSSGAAVPTGTSGANVFFDGNSGSGTSTANAAATIGKLDFTGFTGTFAGSSTVTFTGDLTLDSSMTHSYTGTLTSALGAAAASKTITTDTLQLSSLTISGVGDTYTLQDALVVTGTLTLTSGTFAANGQNVTLAAFSSSNSNVRAVTMGAGTWTITGNNATVWDTGTTSNMTFTRSSAIIFNYGSNTGTRTITLGSLAEGSAPSISITAGTDTVSQSGSALNYDFTGFTGTWANSSATLYGNLVLQSGMTVTAGGTITFSNTSGTKTITSNGVDFPKNVTLNGVSGTLSLVDALNIGSTPATAGTLTITNGTFTANNQNVTCRIMSSNNSNTRVITMGSGTWLLTGTGTIWDTFSITGLTLNSNTSTLEMNDASVTGKTFQSASGTLTFNKIKLSGAGTGTITFSIGAANVNELEFNLSSTPTVTFSSTNMQLVNLDFSNTTAFGGTWSGSGAIKISGNFKMVSGMTRSYTGTITFNGTSGTQDITSATKTLASAITFDGVGGTFRLLDDFSTSSTATLTNGTFNTNGSAFTCTTFSSSNSNTRALTLGASVFTCTGTGTAWDTTTTTGLTFTVGTSSVRFSGSSQTIVSGGLTWNDIRFTNATPSVTISTNDLVAASCTITGSGSVTMSNVSWNVAALTPNTSTVSFTGASNKTLTANGQSFYNVTVNKSAAVLTLQDTFVCTNTLNLLLGTWDLNNKTASVGLFSSSNANVREITSTGGSPAINVTGNNTTVWSSGTLTNWAFTNPLAVTFTYASNVGTRTISGAAALTGVNFAFTGAAADTVAFTGGANNVDFGNFAGTLSNGARSINGNLTLASGMTLTSGASATTMSATSGTKTITSNGKTITFPLTLDGVGGTWQLADALVVASDRTLTLTNGTFNANGQNVTTGLFSSSNSNTRVITMGAGTWTLTGNAASIWSTATVTNLTLNRGNAIVASYSGATGTRTITFGAHPEAQAPSVSIGAATDIVALSGSMLEFDLTGFTGTLSNNVRTVYGNLSFPTGITYTAGSNATTMAATSGTKTITSNSQTLDFPITINGLGGTFKPADALTLGSTRLLTLSGGTFDGDGKNVTIGGFSSSNSAVRVLTMGAGTWLLKGNAMTIWTNSTSTNMTLNRTGVFTSDYAGATGTRTVQGGTTEATSPDITFSGGTDILALSGGLRVIDMSAFSGSLTNASNRTLYSNWTLHSGITVTAGAGATTFAGTSGTQVITSAGKNFDHPITFNGAGGTFQLADPLACGVATARTITLTAGTFDMNGQNLTHFGTVTNTGSGVRVLDTGGATWDLTNTNTATVWNASGSNFSSTGGGIIKISGSTTNIRTFAGGGFTYPDLWFSNATANGQLSLTGSNTFADFKCIDTNIQSIKFTAGTTTTVSTFTVHGTSGSNIVIDSLTAAQHTLSKASGNVMGGSLTINQSIATGGAGWYAGRGSTDGGTNTGWIFTGAPTDIEKDLQYEVLTPVDTVVVEMDMQYCVIAPASVTKDLQYAIESVQAPTKSLQYVVLATPAAKTKSLKYTVYTTPAAVELDLEYVIVQAGVVQLDMQYVVQAEASVTKQMKYAIINFPAALEKDLSYAVTADIPVTKALQYVVQAEKSVTKGLTYSVLITPSAVQKDLEYAITSGGSVIKDLQYVVNSTHAPVTKALRYAILVDPVILQKALSYAVASDQAVSKVSKYTVITPQSVTKTLSYEVLTTDSIQKTASYAVTSEQSKTKTLSYEIETTSALTKGLSYRVTTDSAITKTHTYRVTSEKLVTKTDTYRVLTTPAEKTKSLTYRITVEDQITKSLQYVVRPYPYRKKTSPYGRKNSPYKSLVNPY